MSGSDADLVDAVCAAARFESATMARKLAAVNELYCRRLAQQPPDEDELRGLWQIDIWDQVAAELSAALRITRGRASGLLRVATALAERLPRVAAVFAAGDTSYRVVDAIVSRTNLIDSDEDAARVDALLAKRVGRWNKYSDAKLNDHIDYWVLTVDRLAKRVPKKAAQERCVGVGRDQDGLAELWGTLRAPDALAIDARLNELADTVCPNDPRTKEQRRADATGALAAGSSRLECECGQPDCPAAGDDAATGTNVVIHLLAQADAQEKAVGPGYIPGFGFLDEETLRDLTRKASTRFRTLTHPGEVAAEAGYRPSAALAAFVRYRDLTCRFPGCDAPVDVCDIDHTAPYPLGPTHASNCKLYCRHHHLLKTFVVGPGGWRDEQLPDGSIRWTAPTGHVYTTEPLGALLFPQLAAPTGKLVIPKAVPVAAGRGLMMPTRQRTREQDRAARKAYERGINYQLLLEERRRYDPDLDPPPF